MKKIFTLVFVMAMLSTAFAQYGQKDQRDRGNTKANDVYTSNGNSGYDHHNNGYYGGYIFTPRDRDMQIEQINHEYEHKIRDVKNRYFMSWYQKKMIIQNLEAQRDNEIHEVMHKFNDSRNQFGDFRQKDRKFKKNRW